MTIGDIATKARGLVDADSTSYPNSDLLIELNNAYEEIIGGLIILKKDWSFGDSNYTSLPTGLQNLVAGQTEYQLPSGWLTLKSVHIKDNTGIWQKLTPISLAEIEPYEEYIKTDGQPVEYAKREDFILLFPAPAAANVTTSNGLKIVYDRTADLFTSGELTTGTKTPGFASPYHQLLSYKAALPFAMKHAPERVAFITAEINRLWASLVAFYSGNDRDGRNILTTAQRAYK